MLKKIFLSIVLISVIVMILLSGCDRTDIKEEVFSFIFMSDTQADPEIGDYKPFGDLLEQALDHESQPQMLILGGDNVNSGNLSAEWDAFWDAADGMLDDIIVASVAGNHDNDLLLAEQFDYPKTAPVNNTEGFFYSFKESNIFFIMLDSNIMGAGNASDAEWLSDQLSTDDAINADWRIVVLHHPFWTIADIPRDMQRAEVMRDTFLTVLEENGVDLILCGHQHVYSRTTPMLGGDISDNGIIQIMTASGAKESYSPGEKEYIVKSAETPVFLIISTSRRTLDIKALNNVGDQFDSVTVTNRKSN